MLLYISHLMGKLVAEASFIGEKGLKFKRLYKEIQNEFFTMEANTIPQLKVGKSTGFCLII